MAKYTLALIVSLTITMLSVAWTILSLNPGAFILSMVAWATTDLCAKKIKAYCRLQRINKTR